MNFLVSFLKKTAPCLLLSLACATCSLIHGSKKEKKLGPEDDGPGRPAVPGCLEETHIDNLRELVEGPVYLRTLDLLQSIQPIIFLLGNRLNNEERLTAHACRSPHVAQTLRRADCTRIFKKLQDKIGVTGITVCVEEEEEELPPTGPSPTPIGPDPVVPGDGDGDSPGGPPVPPVGGGDGVGPDPVVPGDGDGVAPPPPIGGGDGPDGPPVPPVGGGDGVGPDPVVPGDGDGVAPPPPIGGGDGSGDPPVIPIVDGTGDAPVVPEEDDGGAGPPVVPGDSITAPYDPAELPEDTEEREDFLSDSYETVYPSPEITSFEETFGIDEAQEPASGDAPSVVGLNPGDGGGDDYASFLDATDLLRDEDIPLDENGEVPYLAPYQPTVYDNESNDFDDPAFADVDITDNYEVYRAVTDSEGNPASLVIGFGVVVESIATGTPSGGYVEPTEEHLSFRETHTVNISNPMPALALSPLSTCNQAVQGSGTRMDPYIIFTYEQLNLYLRADQTAHFELGCDIDASPSRTENGPMGFAPIRYFAGFLNGRGRVISNLYINRPEQRMVGLFAHLIGAEISNLRLENVTVVGKYQVGALAGHMVRSLVSSVKVSGRVRGAGEVGGILGLQTSHFHSVDVAVYYRDGSREFLIPYRTSRISDSHFKGIVNCARGEEAPEFHRMCGGITGWLASGFVDQSTSSGSLIMSEEPVSDSGGTVQIDGDMAGGIVGASSSNELLYPMAAGADIFQKARIHQSHSDMSLYGGISIGGVIGAALGGGNVISESSSTSRIEGHGLLGGIVALLEGSYVVNCYSNVSFFVHYDSPLGGDTDDTALPVSSLVALKFGYSASVASGNDHFSRWQRIYARYLVASRFKVGVQNSYSLAENYSISQFVSDPGRYGTTSFAVRYVSGYYYRLDGSLHTVMENISGIYMTLETGERPLRPLHRDTGAPISPFYNPVPSYHVLLLALDTITDVWQIFDPYSIDALSPFKYIALPGVAERTGPHGARRYPDYLVCATNPGVPCSEYQSSHPDFDEPIPVVPGSSFARRFTNFIGWSASIWDFGGTEDLPVLRDLASFPSDL